MFDAFTDEGQLGGIETVGIAVAKKRLGPDVGRDTSYYTEHIVNDAEDVAGAVGYRITVLCCSHSKTLRCQEMCNFSDDGVEVGGVVDVLPYEEDH